jgi:hypothetical protein
MSANSQCRPLSAPEFLGGGIALAIVALIAFSGFHIAQPQSPLPATPLRYATAAIQSSEASATLSLEQPDERSDNAAATREVQTSDPPPSAATATPVAPNSTNVPPPPAADRAEPLNTQWSGELGIGDATGIQQRVIEAGSFGRLTETVRGSLPDARAVDGQRRSVAASPGMRAVTTFVGGWADDIGGCRTGRKTQLIINSRAAKTTDGECVFGLVAREATNRWRVAAICAADGEFWRANIALKLAEPNLTWSSERGTATYVRCKH